MSEKKFNRCFKFLAASETDFSSVFTGEKGPVIQLINRQSIEARNGLSPKRMIHESDGEIDSESAMAADIPSEPNKIGD